jgi:hypothetical protein
VNDENDENESYELPHPLQVILGIQSGVDGYVYVTMQTTIRMEPEVAERYVEEFRKAAQMARTGLSVAPEIPPSNEVEEWRRKHGQT